jgi:hypothetical protein
MNRMMKKCITFLIIGTWNQKPKFNDYCIPAPYGYVMAQLQDHTPVPSTRSFSLVPRQPLTATIPDPFDYVSLLEELKTYR